MSSPKTTTGKIAALDGYVKDSEILFFFRNDHGTVVYVGDGQFQINDLSPITLLDRLGGPSVFDEVRVSGGSPAWIRRNSVSSIAGTHRGSEIRFAGRLKPVYFGEIQKDDLARSLHWIV